MFISWMLIAPSFRKSLIVEQFQGNYLKSTSESPIVWFPYASTSALTTSFSFCPRYSTFDTRLTGVYQYCQSGCQSDHLFVSPAAGFPRNCLQGTSFSWLLVIERFLSSPSSSLDLAGYLYFNAVFVNCQLHPSALRPTSPIFFAQTFRHRPRLLFCVRPFPLPPSRWKPMFVFSDGIKLPRRHVTASREF